MMKSKELIDILLKTHSLSEEQYLQLILDEAEQTDAYLRQTADNARKAVYQNTVFIRGLIEISNICKNNCYYCGIRSKNKSCERFRLSEEEILSCCREGHRLGFRTFVLQGGEDPFFSDEVMARIIERIKAQFPDSAITLSLGEKSKESYLLLKAAGADRYLLRHETVSPEHYARLHPEELSFQNRMKCLADLRSAGFQVGCGFMVGSPYQSDEDLSRELKFIEEFSPEMCGIGPFIPHRQTPFGSFPQGSHKKTLRLLSLIRIIKPNILLPSTTALSSIHPDGRELGIKYGANVIMPNLSPLTTRKKYELYEGKLSSGLEAGEEIEALRKKISSIGYQIVTDRGDIRKVD